jgi:hypothetical protein
MSLGDEISLNNTAAVPEANADSTPGMVEKIRVQALAEQQTATTEMAKAEGAANEAPNDGFNVLASAALEALAPGAKSLLTGGEFVAMRAADKNLSDTPAAGEAPRAMDKSIVETTTRAPGLYANSATTSVYGGNPKTAKDLSANIAEKAGAASASLVQPKDTAGLFDPGKDKPLAGVKCEDKKLENAAQNVKNLVFGKQIASQKALDSTIVWERTHGVARGSAMGMGGPAANLRLAPRDLQGLMSEARDEQGG